MWSFSPTVILMVTGELLVTISLIALIFYKKNEKLKRYITAVKNKLGIVKSELVQERSQKNTRDKIQQYFEEQIKLTENKYKYIVGGDEKLSDLQLELLEYRHRIFDSEIKTLRKNNLDEGFWEDICERYQSLRPPPEIITVVETLEPPPDNVETDAIGASDEQGDTPLQRESGSLELLSAASDEISRLNGAVTNQYASIEGLKQQIQEVETEEPDLSHNPLVVEMKARLDVMESEQNQMAMCVQVMENENDRLINIVKQWEAGNNDEKNDGTNSISDQVTVAEKEIIEKLKVAERLIKELTQTNKEHLQCISILESELELFHDTADAGAHSEPDAAQALFEVQEQLELNKNLVNELTQTNKEHVQCITILESEVEKLTIEILEKDALLAQFEADGGASTLATANTTGSDGSDITGQLNEKIAELELLKSDYDSMKQKYIELFQQSRAS